jgi:OOP family OmpA-OmpF porin
MATLVGLTLLATPALAGSFYLGINAGQATLKDTEVANRVDFDDIGGKVYLGYTFGRYLAIEGGYMDFGDLKETFDSTQVEANLRGVHALAKATLPLLKFFEIFGKGGLAYYENDVMLTPLMMGPTKTEESGASFLFGLGLGFPIGKRITVRLESEQFNVDGADEARLTTVGVQINF